MFIALVFISYVILNLNLLDAFFVERNLQDTFYHSKCWQVHAYRFSRDCRCSRFYPTYSSKNYGKRACGSGYALGCTMFPNAVLLSKAIEKFRLPPSVNEDCDVDQVMVWNIPSESANEPGIWVDVTAIALHHVYVNRTTPQSHLEVQLPIDIWAGQLIKIILDCVGPCAILKVKGRIAYPFDASGLMVTTQKPITTNRKPVVDPEKSSNVTLYVIVGLVIAFIVIFLIIGYVFRHRLPCYKQPVEKETDSEQPIYAEPTNIVRPDNSYQAIPKQSKDDVYYSTIDNFPKSVPHSSDPLCVSNPVYMDNTPGVIPLSPESPGHYWELNPSTINHEETENEYAL